MAARSTLRDVSTAEAHPYVDFATFLAAEAAGGRPHEWVAGRVYAMAGGTERHDLMVGLLYRKLAALADARGCRAFSHNRLVRLGDVAYYPDVLVVCPGELRPDTMHERDLSIVVEVASPSTEAVDRREKTMAYINAPSFERYVIVEPERRRIEVATRGPAGVQWELYTAGHVVLALDLDVDELYDTLDATALT